MGKAVPLVLLHGWGFDRRIWDDVLPALQKSFEVIAVDLPGFGDNTFSSAQVDAVAQQLLERLPPQSILLGWSLGGLIATHIAIHFPQRVAALITVGSNLKWVSESGWPGAQPDNFAAFFENLTENFAATKQHFCSVIARGDNKEKTLVKILRDKLSTVSLQHFLQGLLLLDSIDNRQDFCALRMPGLHIFGEKDAMVPSEVRLQMRGLNRRQQTEMFAGCAHAPFLSEPKQFVATIGQFIRAIPYQLDKKQIAESFSRAASRYEAAALWQQHIGDELFALLPKPVPDTLLDLGCGTGYYSRRLQATFPASTVISLDLAQGMLQEARTQSAANRVVCGDAECLPLQSATFDGVFSNLAIQWCQDLPALFTEIHRVLRPGAYACLSTFVEGTLSELSTAWQAVDNTAHVNRFSSVDALQRAAQQAGFARVQITEQDKIRHYDSVQALTRELKAVGAHNLNRGRVTGLLGKNRLQVFMRAYEKFRQGHTLPATYRLAYLLLER